MIEAFGCLGFLVWVAWIALINVLRVIPALLGIRLANKVIDRIERK